MKTFAIFFWFFAVLNYAVLSRKIIPDKGHYVEDTTFNLNKYNSYSAMVQHMKSIHRNNDQVEMHKIGESFEGRNLYLMKISSDPEKNKPVIFIEANTHAREWVSSAIAFNLIETILNTPELLEKLDWYIVPMTNPDGYTYSRYHDRLWRKNRSKSNNTNCIGVDLNRNYDFHWGESGVEFDPCSFEAYPGPYPFSEPESKAIAMTLQQYKNKIKLYLALHAFGQYVLYPYGYAKEPIAKNEHELHILGDMMANAMKKVNGNVYSVMSAASWYPGAGGCDDYAYGKMSIPYSYTLEFTKGYHFEYPESKLPELYKESIAAFKVAANMIGHEFGH